MEISSVGIVNRKINKSKQDKRTNALQAIQLQARITHNYLTFFKRNSFNILLNKPIFP